MRAPKFEDPTLEALTLTLVNVGCLWCLIWMQILTVYWYGLPFYAMDAANALGYYLPLERWSLSLPALFLIVTVCGVAVLIPAAICFTRNAQGRLRMLLTIAFFSTLSVGFSREVLRWRTWHCENARNEIALLKNYEQHETDDSGRAHYTKKIVQLESLLRQLDDTQDIR